MVGKFAIYQHLVLAVVNLILRTVWVARKVSLYIYTRHNDLRNLTANVMSEVCKDTEVGYLKLTPLSGEELQGRMSNSPNEAKVDIRTRDVWDRGQQSFSTFSGFRRERLSLPQQVPAAVSCYEWTGKETSLQWKNPSNRTWYIFTPLVFSNNGSMGSMGRECQKFYSRLAQLIPEKRDRPHLISSNWIQKKVYFGLLKSSLLCLSGSRTVCRKTAEFEIGVSISHTVAKI